MRIAHFAHILAQVFGVSGPTGQSTTSLTRIAGGVYCALGLVAAGSRRLPVGTRYIGACAERARSKMAAVSGQLRGLIWLQAHASIVAGDRALSSRRPVNEAESPVKLAARFSAECEWAMGGKNNAKAVAYMGPQLPSGSRGPDFVLSSVRGRTAERHLPYQRCLQDG